MNLELIQKTVTPFRATYSARVNGEEHRVAVRVTWTTNAYRRTRVIMEFVEYPMINQEFRLDGWDFKEDITLRRVLPKSYVTLWQFVLRNRERVAAEYKAGEDDRQAKALGLPPRRKWKEREAGPPRFLGAPCRSDGAYVTTGKSIVAALKGVKGVVSIGDVIVAATLLRQYARIYYQDVLIIHPQDGAIAIVTAEPPKNRATFVHGAGDKYRGMNGCNVHLNLGVA